MKTPLIFAIVAAVFLAAALWRTGRDGFKLALASRIWLLVALIFGAVSAWLWWSGGKPGLTV
ncbi:hypothetical protein [Variovorax rhizosphaerae]|uniref:Uncharacterized protein n=1 Tax=Variovorax rhizosphaerae TaxID=1836200 RepID=A0ABU8WR42_9BURK